MPHVRSETETNSNLGKRRIWLTHVNWRGCESFSILKRLEATKFELLSAFTLRETIFPKFWANPKPKIAKSPLLARKSPGLLCFEFFDNIPA